MLTISAILTLVKKNFAKIEEIKEKSKQELLAIPKNPDSEVFLELEKTRA